MPGGVEDDILPYLLNDTLLFVTQKTNFGTFSPWCFGGRDPLSTFDIKPPDEDTTLYVVLWEAFRIYPEEWIRILKFVCRDGPFKNTFNFWLFDHDFTSLSLSETKGVFGSAQDMYGIDWVLRNIHQRLQELDFKLSKAHLSIQTNYSVRMELLADLAHRILHKITRMGRLSG